MLGRFRTLQKKWKKTLVIVNWTMVFLSTIVSLLPIFINCYQQRYGYPSGYFADLLAHSNITAPVDSTTVISLSTDDVALGSSVDFAMIVGPFLGMSLPALLDLLVDVYVSITQSKAETNTNKALEIVRLSLLERFVFIVSVVCNALYFLFPLDWNVMLLYTIRQVTMYLNTLLSTAPLILFLERTTSVFSPFFTTLIIFLLSLGGSMSCYQFDLAQDSLSFSVLNIDYQYILLATYLLVIAACLWNFVQFLLQRRTMAKLDGTEKHHLDPFHDFSVNHVPACHMVALCLICVINMCWYLSVSRLPPSTTNLLYALLLFATALVFVIEMRVRQNEVMHGLHLLNSKRAFVRFISHEVRIVSLFLMTYVPPTVPLIIHTSTLLNDTSTSL